MLTVDVWSVVASVIGVAALVLEYLAARSRDSSTERLAMIEAALTVLDSRLDDIERWRSR